jgi:hypothetical protein
MEASTRRRGGAFDLSFGWFLDREPHPANPGPEPEPG